MDQALYEMLYIVDTSLGDTEIQRYQKEMRDVITESGGDIRKEANWGSRKLAFEIKKKTEGTYFNMEFQSTPDVPKNIQQYVNTHAAILRHLVIKVPKAKIAQEKLDAEKEQKRLEEARKEREELNARQEAAAAQAAAQAEAKAAQEASTASEAPQETQTASTPTEQTASTESVSQPAESSTENAAPEPQPTPSETQPSSETDETNKTE